MRCRWIWGAVLNGSRRRVVASVATGVALAGVLAPAVAQAAGKPVMAFDESLAASLTGFLHGGHLWLAVAAALAGGLLTALTPCVYPLIPITVRYFGAMNASRRRVAFLAALYVGGMIVLYAGLGTAFAASHVVFGSFLGNPWFVGAVAAFCVAMGASMLGAFTLQLPSSISTRLSRVGGQTPAGAVAMGLVSGLIAAPCTGPVLAVILTVVATTGALFLGFWLMVAFGVGLGAPFLLLALFSSRLPSSGTWMEVVKGVLATAMFVVAAYFLRFAWPAFGHWLAAVPAPVWVGVTLAVLGLGAGIFMLRHLAQGGGKLARTAAVALLTAAISIPLFGGASANEAQEAGIHWWTSYPVGIAQARSKHEPAMVDFTAHWCQACQELAHKTYTDPAVQAEAARFVSIKVDATDITGPINRLFERFKILGLPTVIFINSKGQPLDSPRVTGFVPPARFRELMQQVK